MELREFVYLDEVSVTSLLSSRLGKVPSEFSDSDLRRGRLVEVEVELQADPVFRISAIASAFSELIEGKKRLFAGVDLDAFENVEEINDLLQKLMAGLIPLKCRVTDYVIIER